MQEIIKMLVVLSVLCGISGLGLSYLKQVTVVPIEEQVLTYVQGPAIHNVFLDIDNSPVAERKTFTLDNGKKVIVFPAIKNGKLIGVALEDSAKGFGGDIAVMVGINPSNDTLVGIGITTMKETPGIGTAVAAPNFTKQFISKKKEVAPKSQGGEIDAISGATISSVGVTNAVAKAAKVYDELKPEILKTWQ